MKLRVPNIASLKALDLHMKTPVGNFIHDRQLCMKFSVPIYCPTAEGRVDSYLFSANA